MKSWPARWLRPGQKEKGLDIYYLGSICCSVAMGKKKIHRLGDLQLRIMKILWERGEASVAEVLEGLGREASLAYTTVATMLRKMETRGLVAHRVSGRSFIYRSQVQAGEVSRSMADHFVDRLFEGSLLEAVNHLLNTREVSREELVKLERLITEKKKCT